MLVADAWTSGTGGNLEYTIGSLAQDTSYDVQVRAKSEEGVGAWSASSTEMTLDDVPVVFTSSTTFNILENRTPVGKISANNASSYAITGGADQTQFSIDRGGALSFNGNGADFERPEDMGENNSYLLTVEATSGTGNRVQTATQTITVEVSDVIEPPARPPKPLLMTRLEEKKYIIEVRPDGMTPNTGPDITDYEIQYRAKDDITFFTLIYSLQWARMTGRQSCPISYLMDGLQW